jgi:hypothetical protein
VNHYATSPIPMRVKRETAIMCGDAVTESHGFVHPLVLGERFCGFATDTVLVGHKNEGERLAAVAHEGQSELLVEGANQDSIGEKVFATSPKTFTLAADNEGTEIGRILYFQTNGRSIVKCSV